MAQTVEYHNNAPARSGTNSGLIIAAIIVLALVAFFALGGFNGNNSGSSGTNSGANNTQIEGSAGGSVTTPSE